MAAYLWLQPGAPAPHSAQQEDYRKWPETAGSAVPEAEILTQIQILSQAESVGLSSSVKH